MENNLKKIKDLRFHPSYHKETANKIFSIGGYLANHFQVCIEKYLPDKKWYMPNTEIVMINCSNFDDDEFYLYTKIGDGNYGWMSEVRVRMDEEKFLSLNEHKKRLLIWSKIKEGLLKFIDLFPDHPFEKTIIEKVYEEEKEKDFFIIVSKMYRSKDGKFNIHLERQDESIGHKYYLALEEDGYINKYFIVNVPPSNMLPIGMWRYPKAKKWIGHKFYLDYSSPSISSQIIFDADTKEVKVIDKKS